MGLFSKPEVVVLKDSCDSKEYLSKLQELRTTVHDNSFVAKKIDKEIAVTEAGIFGEDSVLFVLVVVDSLFYVMLKKEIMPEINSMAAVAFLSADISGTYKCILRRPDGERNRKCCQRWLVGRRRNVRSDFQEGWNGRVY